MVQQATTNGIFYKNASWCLATCCVKKSRLIFLSQLITLPHTKAKPTNTFRWSQKTQRNGPKVAPNRAALRPAVRVPPSVEEVHPVGHVPPEAQQHRVARRDEVRRRGPEALVGISSRQNGEAVMKGKCFEEISEKE